MELAVEENSGDRETTFLALYNFTNFKRFNFVLTFRAICSEWIVCPQPADKIDLCYCK